MRPNEELLQKIGIVRSRWKAFLWVRGLSWVLGVMVVSLLIGFAAAGPERSGDPNHRGELYALYVLPSHQQHGVGRGLLRAVAGRFVTAGTRSMLLWVLAANPRARAFYEALGGVVVRDQPIEIGGATFTEVAYAWSELAAIIVD